MAQGQRVDRSRKRPSDAQSYVLSWPLRPRPGQQKRLGIRFHSATRAYNAVLSEALSRSQKVKADPRYQDACQMPKDTDEQKAERKNAFNVISTEYQFFKSSVQAYGRGLRKAHIGAHLGSHEVQVLADQAYRAVTDYHFGNRGRPRFKSAKTGSSRGVRSVSGKEHDSTVRLHRGEGRVPDAIQWGDPRRGGMVIPLAAVRTGAGRRAREEQQNWSELVHAVDRGLLYGRIVRKRYKGRWTYTAQFVVDGTPPARHARAETGTMSIDFGPSQSAIAVTDGITWASGTAPIAAGVDDIGVQLRRHQRHLDRQHRAGSPECFRADGTHKKGRCRWVGSRRAQATGAKIGDLHRRAAAHRKTLHGTYANYILTQAADIRIEKIGYTAWQKAYPHSTGRRGVGGLVSTIRGKAESAGHGITEFSTYTTALSQTCVCGRKEKKPLNLRWHSCPECGVEEDRDVLSAFLGTQVDTTINTVTGETRDTLDLDRSSALYPYREPEHLLVPRHDAAADRGPSATKKRRVRRPPSRRSRERIHARRKGEGRQSRSVEKSGHKAPTATATRHSCGDSADKP